MVDVTSRGSTTLRRSYHSPVREESARRTRQSILVSALELFLEHGYAQTSVADIASAAGVARPTVLAVFSSKAELLRAVVDVAMAGDDEPVVISERTWFRPVFTASTQADSLDAYARACTRINHGSAEVIELVRRAADETPENAELWDQVQANRRFGAITVVRHVQSLGPLRRGTTVARAADQLWVLNDPALYRSLVTDRQWSERTFTAWVSERMREVLVGDGSEPSTGGRPGRSS